MPTRALDDRGDQGYSRTSQLSGESIPLLSRELSSVMVECQSELVGSLPDRKILIIAHRKKLETFPQEPSSNRSPLTAFLGVSELDAKAEGTGLKTGDCRLATADW